MFRPPPARPARTAPASWNIAKTLAQSAVFWGVFLFLIPALIDWLEPMLGLDRMSFASDTSRLCGGLLFVIAGTLGLTSGVVMAVAGRGTPLPLDTAQRLVVVGPYAYVRNPMAVAGLTQAAAVGLYLGSPAVLAYAAAGLVVWNASVRRWEEEDLEARFGARFRHYRGQVRCWIPRLVPYRAPPDSGPLQETNSPTAPSNP